MAAVPGGLFPDPQSDSSSILRFVDEIQDHAIFLLDADGVIRTWNEGATRIKGYAASEVVGRHVSVLYCPEDVVAGLPERELQQAARSGRSEDEGWRLRKDGSRFWAVAITMAQRSRDGALLGFGKLVRDRTDRFVSESKLRIAIDNAVDGFITLDREGCIESFSRGAERIFGHAADEVLGRGVGMLIDAPLLGLGASRLAARAGGAPDERLPTRREVLGVRRNGRPVPLEITVREFVNDGAHCFVMVLSDLSEQKRLEGRLAQLQKLRAVGQMASGVAHDFNNLLTVVLGNAELLQLQLAGRARAEESLRLIRDAAERASALASDLLAFTRGRGGQLAELDLNAVVREALPILEQLVGRGVQVSWVEDPGLTPVQADAQQLGQVLMNLAANARDAMHGAGRLGICTMAVTVPVHPGPADAPLPPGDYALLAIRDGGVGIDRQMLRVIFDPFVTTKPAGQGTGLGLAIVYDIVGSFGGHVEVDSAAGLGTIFWIYLPMQRRTAAEQSKGRSGSRGSILLLPGSDALETLAAACLAPLGFQVQVAEARALDRDPEPLPDVVIAATSVAGSLGVASQWLQRHPQLRMVVVGDGEQDVLAEVAQLRQRAVYLAWPFPRHKLAFAVMDLLLD